MAGLPSRHHDHERLYRLSPAPTSLRGLTRQVDSHSSVAVFSQRGKRLQLKPGVRGEANAVQQQHRQLWRLLGQLGLAVEEGLAFHREGALGDLRGGHAWGDGTAVGGGCREVERGTGGAVRPSGKG